MNKEHEPQSLEERVLKEKLPFNMEELGSAVGVGTDVVQKVIDSLTQRGYVFEHVGDEKILRTRSIKDGSAVIDLKDIFKPPWIKFGVVSDTHGGSKKARPDALEAMYDIFQKEGVKNVFHAGDITEGVGVYRGQELEVTHFGQDDQIQHVIDTYPRRKGITTRAIDGNHDLRAYERGGIDPMVPISKARKDIQHLGQMASLMEIAPNVWMEMIHPAGGGSYALSYKSQRDINNRSPEDLPHVLIYGHYHTAFYMHYRGIDFLQASCFKEAGGWERRLGLNPTIGGYIVEAKIDVENQRISRFKPELYTWSSARK